MADRDSVGGEGINVQEEEDDEEDDVKQELEEKTKNENAADNGMKESMEKGQKADSWEVGKDEEEVEFVEIGKNWIPTDLMLPYESAIFTELHESDAAGGALIITSKGLGEYSL